MENDIADRTKNFLSYCIWGICLTSLYFFILLQAIIQMVDILMESLLFLEAMKKANSDPLKNAILESLRMIDIVQNL